MSEELLEDVLHGRDVATPNSFLFCTLMQKYDSLYVTEMKALARLKIESIRKRDEKELIYRASFKTSPSPTGLRITAKNCAISRYSGYRRARSPSIRDRPRTRKTGPALYNVPFDISVVLSNLNSCPVSRDHPLQRRICSHTVLHRTMQGSRACFLAGISPWFSRPTLCPRRGGWCDHARSRLSLRRYRRALMAATCVSPSAFCVETMALTAATVPHGK